MPSNDILISVTEEPDAVLHVLGTYVGSAYSPQIDVTETEDGHTVAITYDDAEDGITTKAFDVADGEQGPAGRDGRDGEDGYSPTATVTQGDGSATISITDKDGTTTATVHDGTNGRDGTDGVDGFSPTATVTQAASGATISITDKSGTTTASVSNGTDGTDGTDGVDGFSPTVDVQAITGGHEVTITDADGAHSFDVMDGDPAAPGSVTDAMLAPDGIKPQVAQLFGNQLTGELTGTIATASDAYAAPPMSLVVDGRSTQAGTPTPDSPVPILSVDECELNLTQNGAMVLEQGGFTSNGTNNYNQQNVRVRSYGFMPVSAGETLTIASATSRAYASISWYTSDDIGSTRTGYVDFGMLPLTATVPSGSTFARMLFKNGSAGTASISVDELADLTVTSSLHGTYSVLTVPLYDGDLRSLSDDTKDTLSLTYLRPSTREGWAWYSREVVQATSEETFDGSETWTLGSSGFPGTTKIQGSVKKPSSNTVGIRMFCTMGMWYSNANMQINHGVSVAQSGTFYVNFDGITTVEQLISLLQDTPMHLVYPLATPVTTQLDPIELPTLPAPNCTVWCDPATGLQMGYVRDTNIVIAELRAAIADLATS